MHTAAILVGQMTHSDKIQKKKDNRQIVKWDRQKTQDERQSEADGGQSLKVEHRKFFLQR